MKYQSFVIVHDQDILIDLEKKGTFNALEDFTWLFVGDKPVDKINAPEYNVIICREQPNNIEQHKNLLVFTAWYCLVKNNLISANTDFINLFEYDVELPENINEVLLNEFKGDSADIVGYNPLPMEHWEFLGDMKWTYGFRLAIMKHKKQDFVFNLMRYLLYLKGSKTWNTTTNLSIKKVNFFSLINYLEPCIEDLSKDEYAGHGLERYITWYGLKNMLRVKTAPFKLKHYQANSHKTQPHTSNFKV